MTAHRSLQIGLKNPESDLEDYLVRAVQTEPHLLQMVLTGLNVGSRLKVAAECRHSWCVNQRNLEGPLQFVVREGWQADWQQVGSFQIDLAGLQTELVLELHAVQTSGLQSHHWDLVDLGWQQVDW